ncbi:MAG: FAD-dependent oxidoreductase [bacterium]
MSAKRLLLVGGVAGGASCAARARRLSEDAEIVLFEKGPYVSFANCGLPYYVGDVIREEQNLLVATPELFRERFRIDVRVGHEVTAIDRADRTIQVRDRRTGTLYREPYDALVLSPGAYPIRPPLPGIDLPGIFVTRTIPDSRAIRRWIEEKKARRAAIVGGGYIGLEMAENLVRRGLSVTIVEMLPQVMPPLDPEMAEPVHEHLRNSGVRLLLEHPVTAFEARADGTLSVHAGSGVSVEADLVLLAVGIRPETALARAAGLEIGAAGGIRVNEQLRTSDPAIWAVGDAVEVRDFVTGQWCLIPLAGPANRQGRIAADAIFGRPSVFRGVQGTAVCGVLGMTLALSGASEKALRRAGLEYEKIYLHPGHHAGYYPGARPISIKLLFHPRDGRVLGVQAVGTEGVDKRVDVIAMAIQKGATVFDLEEAELCYAPQFGAAKDPVNLAGMVAANVMRGDAVLAHWEDLPASDAVVVDVRSPKEFEAGHLDKAINIPLPELRDRMEELRPHGQIWSYCGVGQRSYYATRALLQNGFPARNLSGGYLTYKAIQGTRKRGK